MAMEVKFKDRPIMPMVTRAGVRVIVAGPAPELLFNHHLHFKRHHVC